ncbi:ABC-type transport auxiliary lipoprotein family protein [Thiohalomonas denitrificans]|uniref:Cholesterol transport system auxiliary component n=1 Tax=Thiohalomonas denitrificans TaxID=415747 RepID=A0A1G5R082_9GAMM|nr:ABC-type transport auxiliary lipoprotein family protein [Thiohalomonas denitrificans]SCZ66729.1 cholesterol transport system auxiliary component [Thiohalomonas denitrificans]
MIRHITMPLLIALLLTGCSLPSRTPSTMTYTLAVEPSVCSVDADGPVIEVATPVASPGFSTTGMAYREQPFELAYFAFSEWAAPLPKMLQPLLVEALESAGLFSAVLDSSQRLPADLRLQTRLLYLIHDFRRDTSRLELALRVQVVDVASGEIIANRILRTSEPAPTDDAYGGVVAANRALERLLPQVVQLSRTGLKPLQKTD